jgi:hypothetical protein
MYLPGMDRTRTVPTLHTELLARSVLRLKLAIVLMVSLLGAVLFLAGQEASVGVLWAHVAKGIAGG